MKVRRGPYAAMDPDRRHRLVRRSIAAVVGASGVMIAIGKPMRDGGHDIIPFEVAGDAATVDRIIEDWGPDGVRAARLQTSLDMGYLALYAVATAAGCATVAAAARRNGRDGLAAAGDLLGWASFVAAGCDAVENAALLGELSGARGPLPRIARTSALTKFTLIVPAVAYSLGGLGVLGMARARGRAPAVGG